jgi:enoyl-CoA hydratase/carnithine racemase
MTDSSDPADPPDLSTEGLAVETSGDGLVVRATVDRPAHRNALTDDVLDGLSAVLSYADGSEARVVVVRGAEGTFCAGADLESMANVFGQGAQAYREGFSGLSELIEEMTETSAIVVAAVEGYCLAGGMGLAAGCDLILASGDATFGTPEVDVGLFPAQALVPIMRTVSEKQGLKLLFTGEHIDAGTAYDIGFVTEVVEPARFDAELDALVDDLASSSPVMISMGKKAFYTQRDMGFSEALSYMREVIALVAMSEDTKAGIEAFLTDSEPEWTGR